MLTAEQKQIQEAVATPAPAPQHLVEFHNVSKFYGEVLGVNRVTLSIPPGITSLVGPNGSGKTTLMNLMTGLIRPTTGSIRVMGFSPDDPRISSGRLATARSSIRSPKASPDASSWSTP
jgi:ABC-type bacteriocin/lantibiotic exporter with double-glycine peptidase domain